MKPQIRFKGFTDDWEQRELGEVCEITMGQSPDGSTYSDTPSDYILVQGNADLKDGWVCPRIWTTQKTKTAEAGDLIMSVRAPAGTMGKTAYNVVLGRGVAGIKGNEFIFQTLVKMDSDGYWKKLAAGSTFESINSDAVKTAEIEIPQVEEQEKIGSYFRNLDHLITLHQRKCETLQKLKKSMLQKMFPKNGELYPEIRFAGFTDAWEQRKFSDFTFPAGERNKDDLDLEPFAITNNQGFIAQSEAHDDFGYMKDVDRKMYIVVKPNSFAYNPARINVGSLGYYEGVENVIVSSLYEVFQTAEYVDDKFLKHWFKTKAFQDWIERLQEGSVRLYFYYDKLCECIMSMPSVEEQRKIGAYLDKIDNLITLHQRKLETLKNLKKSMLQKMFI